MQKPLINYTHVSKSAFSAKQFTLPTDDVTVDEAMPNQAKSIVDHAYNLLESDDSTTFTFGQLAEYIMDAEPSFTTSKHGPEAIIRYYSKRLQDAGLFIPA